jgi:hypothetical protein
MSKDVQIHVDHIAQVLSRGFAEATNDDGDDFSAYDYLADALDIEYIVSSKGEYLGARVLVAFGGPNIWVNTRTHTVEGHWWGDSAYASFTDGIGLDEALNELSPMMREGV